MKNMLFKIITPKGILFEGNIILLTVRTLEGDRGILPHHAPLVSILGTGKMRVHKSDSDIKEFMVSSGLLIVESNLVKIITDNITNI